MIFKNLWSVVFIRKGQKPKHFSETPKESYKPYILIDQMEWWTIKSYVSADGPKCSKDDILVVWDGAWIGKLATNLEWVIWSTIAAVSSHWFNKDYLFYFLTYAKAIIRSRPKWVGIPHVDTAIFNNLQIPLVSLPHQTLIIDEIEKQLSRLDSGLNSLQKLKILVKQYRASVLSSAYTWSIIDYKNKNFQSLWTIVLWVSQWWSPKCESFPAMNEQWGVIKTTAIQIWYFNEKENKLLPEKLNPRKELEIKEWDFLMTRAWPRVRVWICCLVRKVRSWLICCDKVYKINYDKSKILWEYLEIILSCDVLVRNLDEIKTGISDSWLNLTQSRLLELKIPLPSLAEQQHIVAEVERRFSVIDRGEQTITENIMRAQQLKQSILHQAFSGQFVDYKDKPEDIEQLLVQIEQAKVAMKKQGKQKK